MFTQVAEIEGLTEEAGDLDLGSFELLPMVGKDPLSEDEMQQRAEETEERIRACIERVEDETSDYMRQALPLSKSAKLLKEYNCSEGFGDFSIEVFDNWFYRTSANNVSSRRLDFPDGRTVTFDNLRPMEPRYMRDGNKRDLTPKLAREHAVTYGSDWHVDLSLRDSEGEEIDRHSGLCIGTIPLMLKSRNCILHKRTPQELVLFGEDPKDPGGYFIIGGTEKVVLLQELLSVNKIFLMNMGTKNGKVARFTANTPRGTALVEIGLDHETQSVLYMRFPSMRNREETAPDEKDKKTKYGVINVLALYRLYAKITDIDDIQIYISIFIKPEHRKKCLLKLTRNIVDYTMFPDDYETVAAEMGKSGLSKEEKEYEAHKVLDTDFFPHLNNLPGPDGEEPADREERIKLAKIYLLSIMIARFLEYLAGYRQLADRDSWSNKRIESAGRMMEQLFRNAWRKMLGVVAAAVTSREITDLPGLVGKFGGKTVHSIITDTFYNSFITSKWGVKGQQTRNNVAQTLSRESVIATLAHINTVDVGISRTDTQPGPRLVQNSQYGFIDSLSSPEGANCGIVKSLCITTKVSLERRDDDIIRLLIGGIEGMESYVSYDIENVPETWTGKLMVNGKFLGWCDATITHAYLLELRRTNIIPPDISIIEEEDEWLYVDMSPSRPIRPLLIVDDRQRLVIDVLGLRGQPVNELLVNGAMEYVSPWEQEYIKVAPTVKDIKKRLKTIKDSEDTLRVALSNVSLIKAGQEVVHQVEPDGPFVTMTTEEANERLNNAKDTVEKLKNNKPFSHCEIDPLAILGAVSSLIPWPNHNQAPRNTYQVSMGKQALGIYHSNHINRMDGKTKILAYPQRPMVETEMYDTVGLDIRGPGENCTLLFAAWPYTEEDSFIFKREFLDAGGFRIIKYLTYRTVFKLTGEVTDIPTRPKSRPGEPEDRYKYIQDYGPGNANNGLPMIGAYLRQGDCVIGKIQHIKKDDSRHNESTILRYGDEGIVDKILVTSDERVMTVTVKLRTMRVPQEGDKFSPRNAQKGTIGLIMSDIDMPVSADGIRPDIITNVAQIPTRMTVSFPMEMLASKYGAMKGIHINGGAFKKLDMTAIRETLSSPSYNIHEFGYEKMRSGLSGKPFAELCNQGPIFYQALRHHVKDKIQSRSTGQVKPMNHQPPRGRGNRGGLRFGEMERDALISHGASSMLRERLMLVSDAYQTAFCKNCGNFAVFDGTTGRYRDCRLCKGTVFGRCVIPYVYKLLIHLLAAPGIRLRPEFVDSEEYAQSVFKSKGSLGLGTLEELAAELREADVNDEYDAKAWDDLDGTADDYGDIYAE